MSTPSKARTGGVGLVLKTGVSCRARVPPRPLRVPDGRAERGSWSNPSQGDAGYPHHGGGARRLDESAGGRGIIATAAAAGCDLETRVTREKQDGRVGWWPLGV